jgi:heat shock protein HslJ
VIERASALVVLAIALSGCTLSSVPSPPAQPAVTNFSGTAWRMVAIDGQPPDAALAPRLEFEVGPATLGSGLAVSGCATLSFDWVLKSARAKITRQGVTFAMCPADVEPPLFAKLVAATAYASSGDSLILAGPAGQIQLVRDVPPAGDPGRAVLELLRTGEWRVVSGPGIREGSGLMRIQFLGDTTVVGSGDCGFSGDYRVLPQGRVHFEVARGTAGTELDARCDAAGGAARETLGRLLGAATVARVGDDANSVVISGPEGDVVFGR